LRLGQRRTEHRLAPQRADAGLIEDRAIRLALGLHPLAQQRLAECLAAVAVGAREASGGGHQLNSQLLVELR
jgi:hypothetical protein